MELPPTQVPSPPSGARGSRTAAADGETASAAASQDFDSFLRLLTAQLRNQDPLQPMDSTEFVAQLASFSTVEQLIDANETLEEIASEADLSKLAGLIGVEAGVPAEGFDAVGEPIAFEVPPAPGAETAALAIRGPDGALLREIDVDPAAGGRLVWDGRDARGQAVTAAGLSAELIGRADGEVTAQAPATILRGVSAVRILDGAARLVFEDGASAPPEDVTRLGPPPPADEGARG